MRHFGETGSDSDLPGSEGLARGGRVVEVTLTSTAVRTTVVRTRASRALRALTARRRWAEAGITEAEVDRPGREGPPEEVCLHLQHVDRM